MPNWRSTLSRSVRVPLLDRAQEIVGTLNTSGRALFYIFAGLIVVSAAGLVYILNNNLLVNVPTYGGSYTEGIVGTPRFINPVLALSDADHDLSALVYSGLLKTEGDGTFVPDLADHYDISPDGKTYTVYIRPDARFQDGTPVTADDVIFTIQEALDPNIKSPLRANWEGVAVTKVDGYTVQFTLQKPYAPFIENLTMGILPKHLWQNVSAEEFPFSDLNVNPVGSGPYKVASVARDSSGIPIAYTLGAYDHYALGAPYISTFTLKFYQSADALAGALRSGDIEAASGLSASQVPSLSGKTVIAVPLSRVFGAFFNQNQSAVLRDARVRQDLSSAIDRTALIQTVLGGYGMPITGPIPPTIYSQPGATSTMSTSTASTTDPALAARQDLLAHGWSVGSDGFLEKTTGKGKSTQTTPLSFTLSTGNVPELVAAADFLKAAWQKTGAQVNVQVYDQGDLTENVIRPRTYDALLFGEIVGHGLDLFAFWDSSQRNDPGLNIALYANSTVDSLLAQLRTAQDDSQRSSLYQKIDQQIESDTPAAFLYSPDFVYVVPSDLHGVNLSFIDTPSDRFADVEHWYRETDRVWQFFAQ